MKQKIIRIKYINDPRINSLTAPEKSLFRPEVPIAKIFSYLTLFVLITTIESLLLLSFICFFEGTQIEVLNCWITVSIISAMNLLIISKHVLTLCVMFYQKYGKSSVRLRCCCEPSCSQYAMLALRKYGMPIALIKIIFRLRRCHPPGGIDYP